MPFRVRISHNNTIRTVERSLLAADTDGYANAKSGTTRECAARGLVNAYRDMSTSHSQYLSGRSLGGLDGAAALPAATAAGGRPIARRKGRNRVRSDSRGWKSLLLSLLRYGLLKSFGGAGGLSYSPKLIHLTYTTGSANRPRVTARAAKPAAPWFLRAKRGTLRLGDCV